MIFFCFIWLLFIFVKAFRFKGNGDLFSPIKFVALKNIIFNLPFVFLIYLDPESFPEQILKVCDVNLEEAVLWYTIVKSISFISLVFGIRFYLGKYNSFIIDKGNLIVYKLRSIKYTAFSFFIIGLTAYLIFLRNIGGISRLLLNLSSRVEIQSGQKVLYFLPFLSLATLFFMLVVKIKKTHKNLFFLFVVFFMSFLIYSSFGGRKNSLYLIIMVVVGYNYIIHPINISKISKINLLVLVLLGSSYILLMPIIRRPNGIEELFLSSTNLIDFFEIRDLIYSISYTYIDIFAANYFNLENLWYFNGVGDIFLNIFSSYDSKSSLPPIDDGVYFRSIVNYNSYFSPPVARRNLTNSSWPIENFGFAYANLSILGTIIFFFLQGIVFSYFYKKVVKNNYMVIYIFLYVFVIFNFNFSNLRIVQFILLMPVVLIAYLIFYFFNLKKV